MPMVSLVADIDPIQDLHGYDRPWVGGGGKNLFNYEDVESLSGIANNNGTFVSTDTDTKTAFAFTVQQYNGNAYVKGNNINVSASGRYFVLITIDSAITKLRIKHNGASKEFRFDYPFTKEGTFCVSLEVTSADPTVVGGVSFKNVMIESGSTMTAYEPYSNICPISGWDSVDVSVCGINVWDEEWELGGINASTGETDSSSDRIRSKNFVPCKEDTSYYFACPSANWRMFFYDANKTFVSYIGTYNSARVITIPNGVVFLKFWIIGTTYNHDISVNYPSTDHDYHAYNGQTITTTLPQTVYGGTLDVVSGVLTVDRAMVTLNGQTTGIRFTEVSQATTADGQKYVAYIAMASHNIKNNNIAICDAYAFMDKTPQNMHMGEFDGRGSYFRFVIADQNLNTLALWNAHLAENPMTLVYELATPTTIQLTPQQIDSLLGRNNVWADSGDVTVEYIADTKLYIQKVMGAIG